jgi:dinuclear metal center YbgI/SA1388 family protein
MAFENLFIMKLKDICSFLDKTVPLTFQEGYDNSGLQVGDPEARITSALISLDVTEAVVEEAISGGFGLIITHHPLIFSPLRKLSGKTFVERIVTKAIKNDVAVYSSHTNLDVLGAGVSRKLAEKLNLQSIRILSPLKHKLLKLVTYIPEDHLDKVSEAVFEAGAGVIGNYDKCSFSTNGFGSFRGGDATNPFVGEKGKVHLEKEIRFETILLSHLKDQVIKALINAHPYEEVAYDIYALENEYPLAGLGCIGLLPTAISEKSFLRLLSEKFNAEGIRYSQLSGKKIKTVAMCGGAGISLLNESLACGADVLVTSDFKYHDFFSAENKILLVDIGHFESEKFSAEILYDLIIKKFPKFAVRFSETNTNPINYLQ